jgi:hypothetical protein
MDWNDENIPLVCKLFTQQVARGNRPNIHLNGVGYDEVIQIFKHLNGVGYDEVIQIFKQAKGIELTKL